MRCSFDHEQESTIVESHCTLHLTTLSLVVFLKLPHGLFYPLYQDARVPFMLADCVLIIGLHFLDRGLKAEKKLRQIEEEKRAELHEQDKQQTKAMKLNSRDAQRNTVNKPSKGSSAFSYRALHQPRKSN